MEEVAAQALEKIKRKKDSLSAKQRVFAEFVIQNPERVGFLSIMEAAQEAGVSQTTIFRVCKELGYEGYAQFTREIQQALQIKMSVSKTFQLARTQYDKEPPQSIFGSVMQLAAEDISNLGESIQKETYYRCIELLDQADKVAVVGCMASAPLANHFRNLLMKIGVDAAAITTHDIASGITLKKLTRDSLAVLIAFPRYPRATVEIGKSLAESGVTIVSITNTLTSPVVPLADHSFIVPLRFRSFAEPYVAPMLLITAMATELSHRNSRQAQEGLEAYDEYVSRFKLFV